MSYKHWKYIGLSLIGLAVIGIASVAAFDYFVSRDAKPVSDKLPVEVTINDDDGFMPAEVTVPVGTSVKWTNKDGQAHTVISGPFGTNSALPDLNSQQGLGPNDSYEYITTKKGTFSYYDANHPTLTGKITVQ